MIRALGVLLAIAACNRTELDLPDPHRPPPPRPLVAAATKLVAKYECHRCHDVPEIAAPPRDKQCFGCHQQIHDGTFPAAAPAIAKWKDRIASLRHAPSLAHADRFRKSWIEAYVLRPYDVRPGTVAQMPRLPIVAADARLLAMYLVPEESHDGIATDTSMIARGEQLYRQFACARCHRFTGASVDDPAAHIAGKQQAPPLDVAWQLAPDLREARERMQQTQLVEWIALPRGAMPKLGVSDADARALAAFVLATNLEGDLSNRPKVPDGNWVLTPDDAYEATEGRRSTAVKLYKSLRSRVSSRLDRDVTWAEVEREVFRDTCWHCHAVPDFARGDGGPGNTGGFGFAPRGLDLSSYAGISSGSLDDRGERRSVSVNFSDRDWAPRLVAHLLARHLEEAGFEMPGAYGMPLGLPALPLEKIQLVAAWIQQGRPN